MPLCHPLWLYQRVLVASAAKDNHPSSPATGPGALRHRLIIPWGYPKAPAARAAGFILGLGSMSRKRVVVFVDGFNLYHAIDDLRRDPVTRRWVSNKHHLKWLDLWSLSQALVHPKQDELVGAYYFSAYAGWLDNGTQERHRAYVSALRSVGVQPIMGTFKKKPRQCPSCKHQWDGHEEKESDVNLAIHLVQLASSGAYDKAIIFTADTDLAPAIRMVRGSFPEKEIFVAIPERRLNRSKALEDAATGRIRLTESHFSRNLLPEKILLVAGDELLRPHKYAPPVAKK